jgi:ElaB/YqjD/DUF883 family membrane-anchored ribosome-binding protein
VATTDDLSNPSTGTPFPAAGAASNDLGTSATGASSPSTSSAGAPGSEAGSEMLSRVVQGAHETIDRLAESAAPHVHRIQEGVSSAQDMLQSRASQVRETGDEWTESLRTTVRENPLAAVATALAIGMLIARLTR